eukprot:scaffold5089_cov127-Isochrysis_galbana.AAC.2
MLGERSSERARANLWRCPPESLEPPSPSRQLSPSGSERTNCAAPASSSADQRAPSLGRGAIPSARLCATVSSNRDGACGTYPNCRLSQSRSRPRRSRPSSSTCPAAGSYSRSRSLTRDDLPDPEGPQMATVSPARTRRETPRSASASRPPKRNDTLRSSSSPAQGAGRAPAARPEMSCGSGSIADLRPSSSK